MKRTDTETLRLGRLRVAQGRLKRAIQRKRADVVVCEAARAVAEALAEWLGDEDELENGAA